MSVTRHEGEIVFTCDVCSDTIYGEDEDFDRAWAGVRADEKWVCLRREGRYEHHCRDCSVRMGSD